MSGKVLNILIVFEVVVLLASLGVWLKAKSSLAIEAPVENVPQIKNAAVSEAPQSDTKPQAETPVQKADDSVTPIIDEVAQSTIEATRLAIQQNRRADERYYAPVDPKDKPLGKLLKPSIVVEKSKFRLWVFDAATPVKTYRVAAGANTGHKLREGDKRTPEGDYYVCIRKKTPDTPYIRSLGLSYPGIDDAAKALSENRISNSQYNAISRAINNRRCPPWNTALGGAIMIHGKRDNRDQTLGCIALDDDDAIELYPQIPLGTPVRIVE